MDLIAGLLNVMIISALGKWSDDFDKGKIRPVIIGINYILVGCGMLMLGLTSTSNTVRLVFVMFGFHAYLIGVIHIITNDHEKYGGDPAVWIGFLTRCISITGVVVLVFDYSNTVYYLTPFAVGYASAYFYDRANERRRRESSRD